MEDVAQPNPYQVPLEIGSEVYVFEIFRSSSNHSHTQEKGLWYRGYVVASQKTALLASNSNANNPTGLETSWRENTTLADEPSVTVGIFPATHCLIKERLEENDEKFDELKLATGSITGGSLGLGRSKANKVLEPLFEEEDEPDILGNVNTPTKGKKRASMTNRRLSLQSPKNTSTHHARSQSSSTLKSDVQDERPTPPLPSLKTGDETSAGLEEPLIDEIACSLREYSALLYTYLLKRDYTMFNTVKAHIEALHIGRRQLLSKALSVDELTRLRRDLVDRLAAANLLQGLDLVVRDPDSGAVADVEAEGVIDKRSWMSGVRMYKLGVELAYTGVEGQGDLRNRGPSVLGPSDLLAKNTASISAQQNLNSSENPASAQLYHLLMDFKAFFASPSALGETTELSFSLYNKSEGRFLTEECCIILNHQGGTCLLYENERRTEGHLRSSSRWPSRSGSDDLQRPVATGRA